MTVEECKICRTVRIYGNPMGELPAGWAHCPACHRTIEVGITHCGICHQSFPTEEQFETHRYENDGIVECLPQEHLR